MADGPNKWRPQTHETADHSIPYAAGVVLMYGKIEPEHYEDPYFRDRADRPREPHKMCAM